jgi:VCBS repeat protein
MFSPTFLIRRVLLTWLAVSLLGCVSGRALASDLYPRADLDRDGVTDVVSIQNAPAPRGLLVWLSRSKSQFLLPTPLPIQRVAAADVDGDSRLDLVAADTSAKLYVWRSSGKGRLRPMRPRPGRPAAGPTCSRRIQESPETVPFEAANSARTDPSLDAPRLTSLALVSTYSWILRSSSSSPTPVSVRRGQPRAPPPARTH